MAKKPSGCVYVVEYHDARDPETLHCIMTVEASSPEEAGEKVRATFKPVTIKIIEVTKEL